MILSALCNLYDMLAADPESGISLPGYSSVGASAVIVLSETGTFKGLVSLTDGKKSPTMIVPEQKGRSGKIPPPYFLCDNAKYLLGFAFDKESKTLKPTPDRLKSAYEYHAKLAEESKIKALEIVASFLKDCVDGKDLGISAEDPIFQKGNIVFRLDTGEYIHDIPEVRKFWTAKSASAISEIVGQCLITGEEKQPIARTHKMLAGIYDGNATGSSLVGFNCPSFTSYGKSQSFNAPVSESAMFKYTTALNYLLRSQDKKVRIGDTTVVFWAKSSGKEHEILSYLLSGYAPGSEGFDPNVEHEMLDILKRIKAGKPVNGIEDPNVSTYVLGLAPNMARVSVRFWYQSSFKDIVDKLTRFQEEAAIVKSEKQPKYLSIPQILRNISPESKTWWDTVPATYENNLFRSIVSGIPHPIAIYSAILSRIHAEAGKDFGVNAVRTGFLKAVLIRNYHNEGLTVSLNQSSTEIAYNLGRAFAVMEVLQSKANGMSNIRARFFGSASVNPKLVFPTLLNLAQHHIAKLGDSGFYYDKQMESILSKITDFPANLSLEDQGKFVLGYYHQREFIYTKKNDTEKQEA